MDTRALHHDLADGRTVALDGTHFERILAPVTSIVIQHPIPRRFVRHAFMDLDYYAVADTVAQTVFFGDNGDGTYRVEIVFHAPFSGVVRLDY